MAFRYDSATQCQPEFREVFRNLYVTGFSIRLLLSMIFSLIFGLIFSAVLLGLVVYFALVLLYYISGLDLLDLRRRIPADQPSTGSIFWSTIAFIIAALAWLAFFAYLGPHSLIRFKRRLSSRLYVLSGRPLASVEGKPKFDPDSESGCIGIEVGEFYFDLNTDFWLDRAVDLGKLERAGGVMRVWYIPSEMRSWNHPTTGKPVKYNCSLVRAEWRPK